MAKKNDGLVIAGIVAGVIFLPKILEKAEAIVPQGINIFGGEGAGFPDIPDIFGGIGDMFGGLFGGGGLIGGGGGGGVDWNAFLASLGIGQGGQGDGGGAQGGTPPTTAPNGGSQYPPSMENTIPNILNALGYSAGEIAKAGMIGAGTVLGFRALAPAAPVVGRTIASGVRAVGTPAVRVAGSLAGSAARVLMSPVSKLPVLGTAGAALLAGGAGYGIGTALMKYTPIGEITLKKSAELGKKAGAAESGIGAFLFPKATLNKPKAEAAFGKIGLTTAQVSAYLKQGYSPQQILKMGS